MVVKVAATRTVHIHTVNPKTVSAVKRRMRPNETMVRLADTFSALGDPARAKILYALAQEELCVCDLAEVVGVTESAVSHQLRVLRALGLVKYRRDGRVVYYSRAVAPVRAQLVQGPGHAQEWR